jgi:hypothetical protein
LLLFPNLFASLDQLGDPTFRLHPSKTSSMFFCGFRRLLLFSDMFVPSALDHVGGPNFLLHPTYLNYLNFHHATEAKVFAWSNIRTSI